VAPAFFPERTKLLRIKHFRVQYTDCEEIKASEKLKSFAAQVSFFFHFASDATGSKASQSQYILSSREFSTC
jgi:hypothetical protein